MELEKSPKDWKSLHFHSLKDYMACSESQVGESIIKCNPEGQHMPRTKVWNQTADKSYTAEVQKGTIAWVAGSWATHLGQESTRSVLSDKFAREELYK